MNSLITLKNDVLQITRNIYDKRYVCCHTAYSEKESQEINQIFVRQKLTAFVYPVIDDYGILASDVLEKEYEENALRSEKYLSAIQELAQQFTKNEIDFVVLKGIALSQQIYGSQYARISHDIDLLVHEKDIERADLLLRELGYEQFNNFLNNTNKRNDLPHLLIPVIIFIMPLSFLIFNCSRYESLLISIVSLLVFVHCTYFGNAILPLNYFYFNSHYYFLCICTFLCNKSNKKGIVHAKRLYMTQYLFNIYLSKIRFWQYIPINSVSTYPLPDKNPKYPAFYNLPLPPVRRQCNQLSQNNYQHLHLPEPLLHADNHWEMYALFPHSTPSTH